MASRGSYEEPGTTTHEASLRLHHRKWRSHEYTQHTTLVWRLNAH
ncbi:MAG: hypothetical protein AB1589_00045 [Cyanobacteriota bacterium]